MDTAQSAAARPARILVAEDDPLAAELMEEYLAGEAWEVRVAPGGEQALRLVAEWRPDLILLDVMMPKLSGFEVCKRLKADPATRGVVILMVTALDNPSDIDRAVDGGADDFLSKPITKAALLHRVRALLRVKQYERDLDRTLAYIEEMEKRGE